jgi:hypothetical protein
MNVSLSYLDWAAGTVREERVRAMKDSKFSRTTAPRGYHSAFEHGRQPFGFPTSHGNQNLAKMARVNPGGMKPLLKRVSAPATVSGIAWKSVFGGVQANTMLGVISANRQLTEKLGS